MAAEFETSYAGLWNLDSNIPSSTGLKKYGDDNIRGIKYAIRYSFPNVNDIVTATAAQLNGINGTYSNPVFTGTPIAPTQVDTPMLMNPASYRLFHPDLENPTADDMVASFMLLQLHERGIHTV